MGGLREIIVAVVDALGPERTRARRRNWLFVALLWGRRGYFRLSDCILPSRRRALRQRAAIVGEFARKDAVTYAEHEAVVARIAAAPTRACMQLHGVTLGILIPSFVRGHGGAEKVAGQVANVAAEAGARVVVICRSPNGGRQPYPLRDDVVLRYANEHRDEDLIPLRELAFDCLVCFGMAHFYCRIPHVAGLLDAPFVIQECTNPWFLQRQLQDLTDSWSAAEAAALRRAVHAHSAAIRLTNPEYLGTVAQESQPFAHAFFNAFPVPVGAPSGLLVPPSRRIICVGSLKNANKNGLAAVRAFCDFTRSARESWQLDLYGENNFTRDLERLLRENPHAEVRDRGIVDDIAEIYADAHALVIPSFDEGLPNVVVEAFSFGVPCIGFADCAGVAHLVRNGETGVLVNRKDPRALEQALAHVASPGVRQFLAVGASHFAARHFDFATWRHNWLTLIANATQGRSRDGLFARPAALVDGSTDASLWTRLLRTYRPIA